MQSTINQLESEFKFDVMQITVSQEEAIQNDSLLAQISYQLDVLRRRIIEVTDGVKVLKNKPIVKPIDEID